MSVSNPQPAGIELVRHADAEILSAEALAFLEALCAGFAPRLRQLLAEREERRARWASGERLDFLAGTADLRAADWTVAPIPNDLQRRHVEITGPIDRKMIINALNSGADTFMADCEDSSSPTWTNMVDGQRNLRDAAHGTIAFEDPARGKSYRLGEAPATLLVRPRGLHLVESGLRYDGLPIPAAIFDFGLYFFHNAEKLLARGTGPYFYLPKLESYLEARWWADLFRFAEEALDVPPGSIRATVLIETLPAAFVMDEILYELRDYSSGLNCGRWDYIFSFIKVHRHDAEALLPDRGLVTMEQPFMRAYTQLVVKTCHKRGIHAIGGMAAQVPVKHDEAANAAAFDKVRKDKEREVADGHDGTWVAHPALVAVAREAFACVEGDHQIDRKRETFGATADDLLAVPTGARTEAGLRESIRVAVQYLAAWLDGRGCVPLYNLMEDAATAEISRTQLWHWLHHRASLDDGRVIDRALVEASIDEECAALSASPRLVDAIALFKALCFSERLEEFLTSFAYEQLDHEGR